MRIGNATPHPSFEAMRTGSPAAGPEGDDFASTLMDVLKEVNSAQQNAAAKQTELMTGQNVDIADVKIAMERASIALNLTLQVRNKLLEAYQEISRMQV
jgi:flagellar hook-basal body complex protein FliE